MRKPFFDYIKKRFANEKFTESDIPDDARIREEIKVIEVDRASPPPRSPWARGEYVLLRVTVEGVAS